MPDPPFRGNKFAALQQQQQEKQQASNTDNTQSLESTPPVNNTSAAPKRDKFAAMQTTQLTSRSDVSSAAAAADSSIEHTKQRAIANQRSQVWKDLQQAEALTIQLLQLAQETAQSLVRADEIDQEVRRPPPPTDQYMETLAQIHARLRPHVHLLQAYQHPTEPNPTYISRVEWSIAKQKRDLLQDYLAEEQGRGGAMMGSANNNGDDTTMTEETAGVKRKRGQ
jgi:hypothetical protein